MNIKSVLIVGNGNLTYSMAPCLLKADCKVNLVTNDVSEAANSIHTHFSEMKIKNGKPVINTKNLAISNSLKDVSECSLAIVITAEDIIIKKGSIAELEKILSPKAIIAINTESIPLDAIQKDAVHAGRILGLNWTEPVHTTRFLEIITNDSVKKELPGQIKELAKTWNKDAYITGNFGIRSRLMSAMAREAFYLVEGGYASIEDIDRACRNDAGYYLPFAGNCRYMDLMGTYAYGIVMKDLNPDLSTKKDLPIFFEEIVETGGQGMQNGKGLYNYTPDEIKNWEKWCREFSYKIGEIIDKYPFNSKSDLY